MNPFTVKYIHISFKTNQYLLDRGWVVQEALDEMEKSPLFVVEKQNSAKIWCYYCMVQCIQCNLEQRCFWFWRGSVCSGCLSILTHLLIFHVFFSFSISREAKFAVHLKRLPGSLRFRLLIFNVFHFCVYNVCCKFAAVAQYAQITPISPLAMYVIFRCASISWFQAVSGSVTYRFYS